MRAYWLVAAALAWPAAAQDHAGEPVPELPETQWPPVYPPLEVTVTPRPPEAPVRDAPAPDWAAVPLERGGVGEVGDLRGPLGRRLSHDPGWQGDGRFAESEKMLRPGNPPPAGDKPLALPPRLAMILGGRFFGLDPAQIFVHFGFTAEGEKPTDTARGIYTPIDPVYCFEGGASCRAPIAGKHDPLRGRKPGED